MICSLICFMVIVGPAVGGGGGGSNAFRPHFECVKVPPFTFLSILMIGCVKDWIILDYLLPQTPFPSRHLYRGRINASEGRTKFSRMPMTMHFIISFPNEIMIVSYAVRSITTHTRYLFKELVYQLHAFASSNSNCVIIG